MIFRSSYPDFDIPNLPLPQVALRHAGRLALEPALIDAPTGRTVTYGELRRSIERASAGFSEFGVRQHDVVAIFAPNSIEYVIAFHAILSLGATVSTVNPLYRENEVRHQLARHHARFLLTTPGLVEVAESATRDLPIQHIFVIGESSRHTAFDAVLDCDSPAPAVDIDPAQDVAALLCSSGTTGLPKGVMLTHRALVAMALVPEATGELCEQDIVPAHLPFFHAFGVLTTLTSCLATGLTSVILPRFDFAEYLQLIQDYRVTRTFAAPPMLVQLAKNPIVDDYDLSSLRFITCGAAPLGAETELLVRNRIGCTVKQGFGMTEIVPTHLSPEDIPASKQGSVGICAPNTEVMIVDMETGSPLGPGQPGELWARSPTGMKGYLDDPEATAATLDADGWIHTGDLGYADEDGYFYIIDRLKELIKYKAYQVAPAELEALLLTHPAVADAAVVRYPDEEAGEIPKAFVVLKSPIGPDALMAWVAERVAPFKKVRMIEFIDVIPKSATGKILRRELVERDKSRTPVLA